ncbi:MAG: LarC family nickel insertion protein, partial [Nitrospiraceae bacterium]
PGPAVAILAKGIPVYSAGPSRELATPTGLALLRALTSEFGPMPVMTPTAIGYGAGDADPGGWPNALRVLLARPSSRGAHERNTVVQVETNLDDVNPQTYEYVMEQLFSCGALDVTLAPVIMKRGRPGIVLTCLAAPAELDRILDVLFQETTALGVRVREVTRQVLPRRFVPVKVRGGVVRMKIANVGKATAKAAPEYLDCKRIAERTGHPLKDVMEEAQGAYRRAQGKMKN